MSRTKLAHRLRLLWCERISAPQMTGSNGDWLLRGATSGVPDAMRRSSQPVSMALAQKSSLSSSCTRYSTGVRMSPRIDTSLSASTMRRRASSRVLPCENT